MRNLQLACLGLALCLLCVACHGTGQQLSEPASTAAATALAAPGANPLGHAFLPAPDSLPRRTSTSASDDDRLCFGSEWDPALPNHRANSDFMTPDYAGASGRNLGDTAYAIFRFHNMHAYVGKAQIVTAWLAANDQPQTLYAGLANFTDNRWDWYKLGAGNRASIPSFSKYHDVTGEMLVCLLSLDNGTFGLDYILAGDNTLPAVQISTSLNPDPLQNFGPLGVTLDVRGSRSYGGHIVSYDYDFDGDGTFDQLGDTSGLAVHLYQSGNYPLKVRATDNEGFKGEAVANLVIIDPANKTPTAAFSANPDNGDGPLTVQLDASASADPDGQIVKYEWDFENDGVIDATTQTPQISHVFAEAGTQQIALWVTDNFLAKAQHIGQISVNQGWHSTLIENSLETRDRIAVCTTGSGVDARACVAYQDFSLRKLHFAHALTANASSWSAIKQPIPGTQETGFSPSMATTVSGGVPLVAYGEAGASDKLYVISASDSLGVNWGAPLLVDASHDVGFSAELAIVNTIPALAGCAHEGDAGQSELYYFLAKNLDGSDWNAPTVALAPAQNIGYGRPCLGISGSGLFRKPILACPYDIDNSSSQCAILSAQDINGTNWNAPTVFPHWTEPGTLLVVNGKPAFAGAAFGLGQAYYLQALDADGTNWPPSLSVVLDAPSQIDMAVVNGKPVLCIFDYLAGKISYQVGSDADGSAWEAPYVICHTAGQGNAYQRMTVVNGAPVICYCQKDNGGYSIRSLSYF